MTFKRRECQAKFERRRRREGKDVWWDDGGAAVASYLGHECGVLVEVIVFVCVVEEQDGVWVFMKELLHFAMLK